MTDAPHAATWDVLTAVHGSTAIRLVPAAGCNLYSLEFAGRELLKQPPALDDLRGFYYGIPVLYPSPSRVRGSQFSFRGETFRFQPNHNADLVHGLVYHVPWELVSVERAAAETTFHCQLQFKPGTDWYASFPIRHTLKLALTVRDGSLRYTYTVDNSTGAAAVPFGFALHPWFLYQGSRAETFLTIPATHWMESADLQPTGRLIELADSRYDARQPRSLGDFVIDDVFYGMTPESPTVIDFREQRLELTLAASADFTHLVVYSPEGPCLCVENYTCSTDAHNLYAQGLTRESHLLIVEPGNTLSGFVEFRFRHY